MYFRIKVLNISFTKTICRKRSGVKINEKDKRKFDKLQQTSDERKFDRLKEARKKIQSLNEIDLSLSSVGCRVPSKRSKNENRANNYGEIF